MAKGLNMRSVKQENRSLLLYLLNAEGTLSRKELAARLSLTPAAVTKITNELIEEGCITESGENVDTGKSGRREILLSLNLRNRYALGIHAERDCITFSIVSFAGELLACEQIPCYDDMNRVIRRAMRFLSEHEAYRSRLVGIGICIIGSVLEDDFGIWKGADIRLQFEAALQLPVVVENNVKAFAESELIYGASRNSDSVLFLKWGPGIGSAIVANGKVFSGNDASVAEIGHYIVNIGGAKCRCGRYGCLETECSEEAIINELNNKKSLDELLKNCDNDIMNIIEHKIDMVALALTNTATILTPDKIVLFGKMFSNTLIADKLIRQCIRYNANLNTQTIALSPLNDKSAYIGAAAICAKHFFFERNV